MSFPLSLTGSVFTEVARESGTMIDCLGLLMIITGLTPRANEIVVVVVVVCVCVSVSTSVLSCLCVCERERERERVSE